jgi:hypothetical protein
MSSSESDDSSDDGEFFLKHFFNKGPNSDDSSALLKSCGYSTFQIFVAIF